MSKRKADPSTDSIDLTAFEESGQTQACEAVDGDLGLVARSLQVEANVILIAHPDGKRLGTRFRVRPGTALVLGRSTEAEISLPEVLSLSRRHARLCHRGEEVTLEDEGSTNGTFINGRSLAGEQVLCSGDRFQVASVHFKFLHEKDVEHAYYEAIHHLVTRDGLTDVYNKRKYDEELARELARAVRHQRPLSLIVADLDAFKQVNDTYGHLCGDFVLKEFTNRVRDRLRPEQIFARIGGDEFVILAPETSLEGARVLAEKLRESVAARPFHYASAEVDITCSFGVAELSQGMESPEQLYAGADSALYVSKGDGRNRVSLHTPA